MGFFNFLSGILGGAADIGDFLSSLVSWIVNVLSALFTFVINALVAVGNFLLGIVKAVGGFLQHIWDKFFKGIFTRVWRALVAAHDWLETHLRPIIRFLQRVNDWINRIYLRYVRPFINLLQHIRRFLLILRLLHVKFAQELDAQISKVEGEIARVFTEARSILNLVVGTLNIIVDPTVLIRRPVLIVSLRRNIGAIIRVLTGVPPGYFFPSSSSNPAFGWAPLPANFNPLDPAQNPPASAYLAHDEGLGAFNFVPGDTPMPDDSVDDLEEIDAFGFLAPAGHHCLFDNLTFDGAVQDAQSAFTERAGQFNDIGVAAAAIFQEMVA